MCIKNFLSGIIQVAIIMVANVSWPQHALGHSAIVAEDNIVEIVDAAMSLLETVPKEPSFVEFLYEHFQRNMIIKNFDDVEAKTNWSYWPAKRDGLLLRHMAANQRALTQDLLSSVLSAKGHLKIIQIMQLEEILRAMEVSEFVRSSEDYAVVFFGMPSYFEPWAFRFEGHHVSITVTIIPPEKINVTPTFLGSSPAKIDRGPLSGVRALRLEEFLARRLACSLNEKQQGKAIISQIPPADVLSTQFQKPKSEWENWKTILVAQGLSITEMDEMQSRLLRLLVEEILTTYRSEIADSYLGAINVNALYFAWMGSLEEGEPHYYRITGSDFVFEYENSQDDANHIHTVWRDPLDDFGAFTLANHYKAGH